ncbi:hypothetical protein DCO58_09110 [Helicobacter saguini]|uniref:Uncharacterized protein n=1 Tax=Helicobacter saguini TaxID=1548018 RepID=A0A4U8T4X3_9HELI|nr:hypothetical protein [Helicobacter saguini]MWV61522.1 hypothetical protein [Helicobacter saguini]MWV67808.1 hypothetical protein [Helicobacter saguini]MWV70724.1 hypothetical protein [Helicobacter saguini]MWV72627.1 hypothetical protein [Helicobacter saguini]TLD94565.1 hypothetical protein LS64_005210 [Helicobacter saguini]
MSLFTDTKIMNLAQEITQILFNTSTHNIQVEIYSNNELNLNTLFRKIQANLQDKEQYIVKFDFKITNITLQGYINFLTKKPDINIWNDGILTLKSYRHNTIIKNFILQLYKKSNDKNIDSLSKLIDNIDNDIYNEVSNLLDNLADNIKKEIKEITESKTFDNIIKHNIENELNNLFNDIKEYIKTCKDYEIKKYLKILIESVFTSFSFGRNPYALMFGLGLSTFQSFTQYDNFKQTQYDYAFKNPISKFISTQAGLYANLIESKLLSNAIIFEYDSEVKIIDISGFNLNAHYPTLPFTQEAGLILTLDSNILTQYLQGFIDNKRYISNINHRIKNQTYSYNICSTKNLNTTNANSNTFSTNIFKHKTRELRYLSYIESPFFNSAKFVEIIMQENYQYNKI